MSGEAVKSEDLELFHFGVKGMKWGVTKKSDSSGGSSSKPNRKAARVARDQGIKDSRARQIERSKEISAKLKERKSTKAGSTQREKINKLIDDLDDDFINNDDFNNSYRHTTGEKWLNGASMAGGLASAAIVYSALKVGARG